MLTHSEALNGVVSELAEAGGLSRPTSSQQVAEHIRRMIFTKELRAGERVPQDEIAAKLRVSRVPVREAVIALDREGWVTSEPHRGAYVNALDENSVLDHYELLGHLHGFAARRATERGDAAGVARLVEINRILLATDDPAELWAANGAYLDQLVVMADSLRIKAMVRIFGVGIVGEQYFEVVPGVVRVHKRGLRLVTRAIKAGDGATAQAEYQKMVRREATNVVALLASRGHLDK